jgi:hypothetical protein
MKGCDGMLFEATHAHKASQCPLLTSEGKGMLKQLFSEQNMKNSGVNLVAAYMSCPQDAQWTIKVSSL